MSIPALRDLDNLTLARVTKALAREAVCGDDIRLRTPFAINYMANPDAEINATGWVAGSSSPAGTSPNAGEGAGGITVTRSTADPLSGSASFLFAKDAANRQGYCARFDIAIDRCDQNRSLTLAFRVNPYTGTYTPGAVSVWMWDVDAAKLCPIGQNSITAAGAMAVQWTSSGSTNYRIILHVAGTDTSAYDLQFDNFYLGPAYLPGMPAMSDWQDGGAITITATTTNPTKGTTTQDKVWWRRVGDSAEIRFEYAQGAGSAGSGDYLFALPAGLSIDTAKMKVDAGANPFNGGAGSVSAAIVGSTAGSGEVIPYDATRVRLAAYDSATDSYQRIGSGYYGLSNASLQIYATLTVPIAGWSGTTAVQPGSRYLWAQRFAASAVRVTTTPSKPGEYRARRIGTDTAPTGGPSAADGFRIDAGSGIAAGRINSYDIFIGPGKVVQLAEYRNAARTGAIDMGFFFTTSGFGCGRSYDPVTGVFTILALASTAGDCVGVDTAASLGGIATGYFDILVADDPVPVALAPAVHVEASSDAGQVVTANTTDLQWEDEQTDTHGAWSGTVFTAPVAGVYDFCGAYYCNAAASNIVLYVNGSAAEIVGHVRDNGTAWLFHGRRKLAAGDAIKFRASVSSTRDNSGLTNWLRITRVGD